MLESSRTSPRPRGSSKTILKSLVLPLVLRVESLALALRLVSLTPSLVGNLKYLSKASYMNIRENKSCSLVVIIVNHQWISQHRWRGTWWWSWNRQGEWFGKVTRNDVIFHKGYNAAGQLMVAAKDHTTHVDCCLSFPTTWRHRSTPLDSFFERAARTGQTIDWCLVSSTTFPFIRIRFWNRFRNPYQHCRSIAPLPFLYRVQNGTEYNRTRSYLNEWTETANWRKRKTLIFT